MEEWQGKVVDDAGRKRDQVRDASARYADRQYNAGLVRIAVWVPREQAAELRVHARRLVERFGAPSLPNDPQSASRG